MEPKHGTNMNESIFNNISPLGLEIILHNLRKPPCGAPHWVVEEIEGKVETSSDVGTLRRGLTSMEEWA